MRNLLVAAILLCGAARAYAYPQFQLSKDQTCSNCHISPAGGGLLSENGLNTADAIAQWGGAPEFLHNKIPLPKWLTLGGDLRGAFGADNAAVKVDPVVFPMQVELYGNAQVAEHVSLHADLGLRSPQDGNAATTFFMSREHWVQWQDSPGDANGMFIRVGRMMPVFGLRYAEHIDYDRKFGGTPLYGETYAAAADYIQQRWELHATAFVPDPIIKASVNRGDGVAIYTECRTSEATSVGLEGMFVKDHDDQKLFGGVTGKHLVNDHLLFEAELQTIHQKVEVSGVANQLVGYGLASYFVKMFMIDVGLGYYNENLAIKGLDRDAIDLNLHWFTTSHLELIWNNRFQAIEFGSGGSSSYYSLLQIHYRL